MNYIIVEGGTNAVTTFVAEVNKKLEEGYKLCGGVCVDSDRTMFQALIKR